MEFVCIEAKAFMEMNEALEAVEKKMRETCGGGICSMDDWIDNQEACMLMNVSPESCCNFGEAGLSLTAI